MIYGKYGIKKNKLKLQKDLMRDTINPITYICQI